MNEDYTKAYFHSLIEIKQPFAVITAYNPYGKTLALSENLGRHKQLLASLSEKHLTFQTIDVGAKNLSHIETSIAIPCNKLYALALAKSFEQDDIFWVEDDQVYIINCASGKTYRLKSLTEMYF